MGNCLGDSKRLTAEIVPHDFIKGLAGSAPPTVKLYGSPTDVLTSYIRFALLYKSVKLVFVPSETPHFGADKPVIQFGSETFSGSRETLLRYIDARFPHPPLITKNCLDDADVMTPLVVVIRLTTLQHRSMTWHAGRLVRWAEDLAARGGRKQVDPAVGSPRMEMRKFGKSYSQLLEVMVEHAQMEERVIFPILELADRGVCKAANEEHARDLPIMNGIKEDIKSIGVLDSGNPVYEEALLNLSKRLHSLEEHCKQHFVAEENDILPLMEAVELNRQQQERLLEELLNVMQATHSRLLNLFLEGLLPQEAMQYLDLITRSSDKERSASMLRLIVE